MPVDFSVVIPTFRRPKPLKAALLSVLSQEDVQVEIFVVDDSPEYSAAAVVENLNDLRVVYVKNPQPTGGKPSIVRNIGWPLATGDYVHFLDDDDIVPEGHYRAVKEAFSKHRHVGMIFGEVRPFGECSAEQLAQEQAFFRDAYRRALVCRHFGRVWPFVGQMLFARVLLVCSASVIRRECLDKVGGYDPDITLMEDGEFHIRIMRECGAHVLDRTSLNYRVGTPSLMHSSEPTPDQLRLEREGRQVTKRKYIKKYGLFEYYGLGLAMRVLSAGMSLSARATEATM